MTVCDPTGHDPMPQPPSPADYDACCGSGCDPCIFDLYDRAVERYRKALQEWHERHPEAAQDAEVIQPDHAASSTRST